VSAHLEQKLGHVRLDGGLVVAVVDATLKIGGSNVMINSFVDFRQFSAKTLAKWSKIVEATIWLEIIFLLKNEILNGFVINLLPLKCRGLD
jgi:hypothetical protein